jgi:hypothetical protein
MQQTSPTTAKPKTPPAAAPAASSNKAKGAKKKDDDAPVRVKKAYDLPGQTKDTPTEVRAA